MSLYRLEALSLVVALPLSRSSPGADVKGILTESGVFMPWLLTLEPASMVHNKCSESDTKASLQMHEPEVKLFAVKEITICNSKNNFLFVDVLKELVLLSPHDFLHTLVPFLQHNHCTYHHSNIPSRYFSDCILKFSYAIITLPCSLLMSNIDLLNISLFYPNLYYSVSWTLFSMS